MNISIGLGGLVAVCGLAAHLATAPQPLVRTGSVPEIPALADSIGPLRVSADKRHLVDENGDPFFWLGDTPWSLFTSYPKSAIVPYLEDRSRKGFTVIQAVICWHSRLPCMPNQDGFKPFLNDDPRTPNEAFFENVDWVIDRANERRLVVALFPVWGHTYISPAGAMFNADNAREFGRYVGARYRDRTNIVWVLGGDTPVYDKAAVHRELAAGIRETDTGRKLMTYHPSADPAEPLGGTTVDPRFNPFGANETVLDFNMSQSWSWSADIPRLCGLMYRNTPVKPGVLAEGMYEAGEDYPAGAGDAKRMRTEAWWSYLSGAGYTYGHFAIWRHDPRWREALDDPAARSMAVLRNFLGARRWWRLVPDASLIVSGAGSGLHLNVAARSADGDELLVYFSEPSSAAIDTRAITSGKLSAVWFNPETGVKQNAGTYVSGVQTFSTPAGWPDAVLALDARSASEHHGARPVRGLKR